MSDPLGLGAAAPADYTAQAEAAKAKADKENADKEARQRAILRAAFPEAEMNAAPIVVAQEARAKELTPSQGSISQEAADTLGLNPTNIAVVPDKAIAEVKPEATPVAPVAMPTEPVKAVTADGPATVGPGVQAPTREEMEKGLSAGSSSAIPDMSAVKAKMAEEVKANPKIGEKLLKLAQDTGKSLLELVQGFAVGYSGSNIPLASQVRQAEKAVKQQQDAQAAQAEKERNAQAAQADADREFQMRVATLNQEWQDKRFAATTEKERKAADDERKFQAEEAAKDRAARIEEIRAEAQAKPAAQGQASGLGAQIQAAIQALR